LGDLNKDGLHELTGRAIIKWCELNYNKPEVKDLDDIAKTFRVSSFLNSATPNPTDNIEGLDL